MQEGPARTHARVHTHACAHMNTHRPVHTASLISFVLHPCSCFTSRAHYQRLRDKYRIWVIKRNLFFFLHICVFIYKHNFLPGVSCDSTCSQRAACRGLAPHPTLQMRVSVKKWLRSGTPLRAVCRHCTRHHDPRWRRQRAVCRGAALWSRSPAPESPAPRAPPPAPESESVSRSALRLHGL